MIRRSERGFTMVEIAICLAVIGFALVAIIGVLPIGMSVQKDNREETIINFDANYIADAIRSGGNGVDDLTNYVNSISVTMQEFDANTLQPAVFTTYSFAHTNYFINGTEHVAPVLTNGQIIIGLLSLPKYTYYQRAGNYYYSSNTVTAYMHNITGAATDVGVNAYTNDFSFAYVVNVETVQSGAVPFKLPFVDPDDANFTAPGQTMLTNNFNANQWQVAKLMQANSAQLRLRFRWPSIPNPAGGANRIGNSKQTYRTVLSGKRVLVRDLPILGYTSFFNQTASYTNKSW